MSRDFSFKEWNFVKLNSILENIDDYDYFYDVAVCYLGMGHISVLAISKKTGKLFIRYDGGANGYERMDYYESYQHMDIDTIKNHKELNISEYDLEFPEVKIIMEKPSYI